MKFLQTEHVIHNYVVQQMTRKYPPSVIIEDDWSLLDYNIYAIGSSEENDFITSFTKLCLQL